MANLKLLFIATFIILSSCAHKQDLKDGKPSLTTDIVKEPLLELSHYNEVSDYYVNDKKHFKEFLDKYWDKIVLKNRLSKEQYIENFQERSLKKTFIEWMHNSIVELNNRNLAIYHGKMFSYFYQNRGKEKTIFYSHGNVSPFSYWAEFASAFNDRFKDYNVVFIHSTKINHDPKSYSAEELNSLFEDDTKSFFVASNLNAKESYFNIVCHSALFTYDYFKNNPNGYAKIIYYAPMIKKSADDVVQNFSNVFPPDLIMDNFYAVYYLYSLSTPRGTRTFPIPQVSLSFNIATEKNLTDLYYKGLDISQFNRKALIYAEKESMLVDDSYSIKDFNPQSIIRLSNMYHHDYFSVRDRFGYYFDSLEKLISQ